MEPIIRLEKYQEDALNRMHNGCILNGSVGSGKSLTAVAYYTTKCSDKKLYIITTARKRDTHEWEIELARFRLSCERNDIVIDSWNNLPKYMDATNSFFIFDEQRVVGKGVWVNAFLMITRKNAWILLSATPGDTWIDYIPVFIANGYFKNRSEFNREHVIFSRFTKYPKIMGYMNEWRLLRYKRELLVEMNFDRPAEQHHDYIICAYDIMAYKRIFRERFNHETGLPFSNASELCQALRKVVNSDPDRIDKFLDLLIGHEKVIVFYNYDYELDILRDLPYRKGTKVAEWNGHKHMDIPKSKRWVYLVQYAAGCEGWNCILTDTIIFWSSTYSYKQLVQACGRIDRMNTPFLDLYYYHLTSKSSIDISIERTLRCKKQFNEKSFAKF